jgi:hypothetical protein
MLTKERAESAMVEIGKAINANNGRCALIENALILAMGLATDVSRMGDMKVYMVTLRFCDGEVVAASSVMEAMNFVVAKANVESPSEFSLDDVESLQEIGDFGGVGK